MRFEPTASSLRSYEQDNCEEEQRCEEKGHSNEAYGHCSQRLMGQPGWTLPPVIAHTLVQAHWSDEVTLECRGQ
jgi:hypothetical protein